MKKILYILILFSSICFNIDAQEDSISIQKETNLSEYEEVKIPPLSVFLKSVYEHASIKIYDTYREEEREKLRIENKKWLNYFRLSANYQYGKSNAFNTALSGETSETIYSINNQAHSQYAAGVVISIPIGDLFTIKNRIKAQKAVLRRVEYEYDIAIEQRKLRILEAYNSVIAKKAVLKAKSDAAALYNAQMKISEQDFIQGKVDLISLSLERGRRTSAVVNYQEGRADLYNAITTLEMLSNVKIIDR